MMHTIPLGVAAVSVSQVVQPLGLSGADLVDYFAGIAAQECHSDHCGFPIANAPDAT